ncbi:pectinesterase family protein [Aquabacterium sp.]|uniref:pectinesterase family protein n=1 Tax=Aquabacterium sp. TaxID=1872578 RepID=UPI002C390007|nr:pectinesterase family protein [Aquabacterium sp.]HSW07440.1 pectinesterase family protein [Aquabacterium sp.]
MPAGLRHGITGAACAALVACAGDGSTVIAREVRGSVLRPQLSDAQALAYTRQRVLAAAGHAGALVADGWEPLADLVITGRAPPAFHYRVDPAAADGRTVFATVQAAVNRAHGDAALGALAVSRVYIGIAPGSYHEVVYVPAGPIPITLWGQGADPAAVRIHHALDAGLPVAAYIAQHAVVYEAAGLHADIAAFFRACSRQLTLNTGCTPVMWVKRDGFQARNLTVDNGHDPDRGDSPLQPQARHQAVAFKSEGADRVHLEQVRLLGHQDTLYLTTTAADRTVRSFIHRSLVAGDVDFIFGPTTAYFQSSEIRWVGGRRQLASGYIAAPSTNLGIPYGFVFEECDFTHEGGSLAQAGGVHLARQWFTGATCSPYGDKAAQCAIVPGGAANTGDAISTLTLETVGKMAVLNSRLGSHLKTASPWAPWQAERSARNHRPVQTSSDDFWHLLQATGKNPAALGYRRPDPAEPYLAEYRNSGPGKGASAP